MAKKVKKAPEGKGAAPAAAAEQPKVRSSDVVGLIEAKVLKALLKADTSRKEMIDGIVGENREAISYAKEKQRLDPVAYGLLKRFHRIKSNEKLANLWDTICAYMDMNGTMARIESVPKLELDGTKREGEEPDGDTGAEEPAGEATTVVKGDFGSGRAVEEPVH